MQYRSHWARHRARMAKKHARACGPQRMVRNAGAGAVPHRSRKRAAVGGSSGSSSASACSIARWSAGFEGLFPLLGDPGHAEGMAATLTQANLIPILQPNLDLHPCTASAAPCCTDSPEEAGMLRMAEHRIQAVA